MPGDAQHETETNQFDNSKAYQEQEEGIKFRYLMNVGDDKGRIVAGFIAEHKPQVMVELGGYVGYSCILFGDAVRAAGGKRYFCLERNPEFAGVIMALVDLAGLSDVVKIVVGSSADSIKRLHANGALQHIDMMFLDHYKPAYTTDLKLCEHLRLVTPGTLLAADNVIKPGNPPYLRYVRSSVPEKLKQYESSSADGDDTVGFGSRWKDQYKDREGDETLNGEIKGNPNLVYESQLVNSFEPTGVPDMRAADTGGSHFN
ncbi:catechol O-methyltransferase, partial [Lecanoromycetidae sp. Uapishka_2]